MEKLPSTCPTSQMFETERLQLATYLHASERLRFSHLESNCPSRVRFIFLDPDGIGDSAEVEFEGGAPVAAVRLFASQKFLRRKMTQILNQTKGTLENANTYQRTTQR